MKGKQSEFWIDVRTKCVLLLTTSIIILKASYSGPGLVIMIYLGVIPFLLLLFYKNTARAIQYLVGFIVMNFLSVGETGVVVMGMCGIFTRLLPIGIVGYIFISTTKVNEFTAAMDRLKLPKKLSIPIVVLLRFFPTLAEEYHSIADAMKMRGIRFGGKHPGKMLEYRMIPFLMSSMRIGDELSAAAITRGLGAPVERTSIARCGFGKMDIVMLVLCVGILILFFCDRAKFIMRKI